MRTGEIIEAEILSNGVNGEGVARVDGKVVFIPYAIKGERVRAVVKQSKSRYATAHVIKVLEPSPLRAEPACPYYYGCGGCDMWHVTPEYRKSVLLAELEHNLKSLANIDFSPEFCDIDGESALRRNKLSMPFGNCQGKLRTSSRGSLAGDLGKCVHPQGDYVQSMHTIDGERNQSVAQHSADAALLRPQHIVFASPKSPTQSCSRHLCGDSQGKVILGFYRQNTHEVLPVDCILAGERSREIARSVCEFANAKRLSVYDERTGRGLLRHLAVREIGDRVSVTLVINAQGFDCEAEPASLLPAYVDYFICPNTKRNNVIMGDRVRLICGNPRIKTDVLGIAAEISPLAFFQVNDRVRDALYSAAISRLQSNNLIDLYSGIGITSNLAARQGINVTAVECVPQAVEDANVTARLNGNERRIKNVCGNAEDVLQNIVRDVGECDVLLDPPRKGCDEKVISAVAEVKPRTLIYISCNNATLCRDLGAFVKRNPDYVMTCCTVFDMFPFTHHSETLAVLERL